MSTVYISAELSAPDKFRLFSPHCIKRFLAIVLIIAGIKFAFAWLPRCVNALKSIQWPIKNGFDKKHPRT